MIVRIVGVRVEKVTMTEPSIEHCGPMLCPRLLLVFVLSPPRRTVLVLVLVLVLDLI